MGKQESEPKKIIFPHLYLSESRLKIAGALFPRLYVPTVGFTEQDDVGFNLHLVSKLYPPEEKNPPAELKKILPDVKKWIETRRELRFGDFLKALLLSEQKEEMWDITAMIKEGKVRIEDKTSMDMASLYYYILYLFRELEKNQTTVDSILEDLEKLPSPLEGALEEPATNSPYQLSEPLFSEASPLGDEQLELIIKAWFWTFGEELNKSTILITFAPEIFQFVIGEFEESASEDLFSAKPLPISRFEFPNFSGLSLDQFQNILSEEKVSKLTNTWKKAFNEAIKGGDLTDILRDIDGAYGELDLEKTLVKLVYFPDKKTAENHPWVKHLCGNLLVCFLDN